MFVLKESKDRRKVARNSGLEEGGDRFRSGPSLYQSMKAV